MLADFHRLRRQWLGARKKQSEDVELIEKIQQRINESVALASTREALLPSPTFPDELPVTARMEEIRELISENQVVVLCGETGSGKSTQLPKICLSLGRGVRGKIGHTQPRRIAARSLASRIASEMGQQVGESVG
ncbi:MAG: ATP-dependent RNA helicase HrpA, partial [bacterium]